MRALGILAGAALIALAPAAVSAADMAGATAGVPMQGDSAWGHGGGWQGGAPIQGAPMPGGYMQGGQHMGPPQGWHGGLPPRWNGGGHYQRPVRGWRVPRQFRDRSFFVADWNGWGFGQPGPGMNWVRYYDDALLIDSDGRVVDCRYGVDWDGSHLDGAYAGGPGYGYPQQGPGYPPPGYGYPQPGTTTYQAGPNTTVSTTVTPLGVPSVYSTGGCGACGGTVVTVTPGMAVTTTTTTTDYQTVYRNVAVRRKVWRRPIRRYHPRCVQRTCAVQGS